MPNAAAPLSRGVVTAIDGIDCADFKFEVAGEVSFDVPAEAEVDVEEAVEVAVDGVDGGGFDTKEGKSSMTRVWEPPSPPPVP